MSTQGPEFLDALVAYHLGTCDESQRALVDGAVRESAQARRQHDALRRALRPLDAYTVKPDADVAARVLARIDATERTIRLPDRKRALPRGSETGTAPGSLMSWRDVLSLAAAILIFVGIFVPGLGNARSAAQRTLCIDHMRDIGNALAGYANSQAGMLPFSGASHIPANMLGVPGARLPRAADNLSLLQQAAFVHNPAVLNCPAAPAAGAGPGAGYSYQVFVRPQRINQLAPRFPIVSDSNPFVRDGVYVPAEEMRNSNVHGPNAGQSVLYLDGSARWQSRPNVGIADDDIFRVNQPGEYSNQSMHGITDAFLVP